MIPSPSELQYFIEVAATCNISRAAERLGISQPSLSLAMRRVEDAVGTPLLIRGKGGVQLTRAGQRFLTHARQLLQEWEELRQKTLREETEIAGRYVFAIHPSVALYCLPSFLPDLLTDHPALEVKLRHGLSREATDDVISFKADFGLVINPTEHPDLVIHELVRDEVTLWRRTGRGKNRTAQEVLIYDPDLIQSQAILKRLPRREAYKRHVTSGNLEVITSLVSAGCGTGILPTRVAQRQPADKLKKVTKAPTFQDRLCLVYRADAQKSQAGRRIREVIKTAFQ